MKIRLTCSFFGCLNEDFLSFNESGSLDPEHRLILPDMIGFVLESGWTLDSILALDTGGLARFARRSIETAGLVESVDFHISLPGPGIPRIHSLADDLLKFIDRLETAFTDHTPLDWSFVSPELPWQERLCEYQRLRTDINSPGQPSAGSITSAGDLQELLSNRGISWIDAAPREIPAIRARRFPRVGDVGIAPTLEEFAAITRDESLLVTADAQLFSAWKEVHLSPFAARLPAGWGSCLGTYWHLLPLVSKHLALASETKPESGNS